QRLGVPPARTLADCLAVLDLAEGERRGAWHRTALAGAATTADQAAVAHARRRTEAEPDATKRPAPASPRGKESASEACAVQRRSLARPEFVASLGARLHDALHERTDRTAVLTDPALAEERGPEALRVAAGLVTLRAFAPARDIARGYLAYLD